MSAPPRPSVPPTPTERPSPPPLRNADILAALSRSDGAAPYINALRKRARLVIALPIIFGGLATAASMSGARNYEAHAAFLSSEPQSLSGSLGSLSSIASQLGVPALSAVAGATATGSAQFYGDLLVSNAITHTIVTTKFDASNPGEYGGKPFSGTLVEYYDAYGKTPADKEVGSMRKFAKSTLKVVVDRPTGIVRFTVRTKNRLLSGLIARQLLDQINDFNLRRRQTTATAEREFALKRTAAAADSLRAAEAVLADFRATNIDFSRSPRLATREAELQRRVALAQQTYTTIAQRYELANIEAVRNTPVVTIIDAPEGLVEARPRGTAFTAFVAFAFGLLLAAAIALNAERRATRR